MAARVRKSSKVRLKEGSANTLSPSRESKSPGKSISPRRSRASLDDVKGMAYQVLSEAQTAELLHINDPDQLQTKMAEVMKLKDHPTDLKQASTLDYYVSALWWAKQFPLPVLQTSAFFTAVSKLLDNVKDKQMSLLDNLKEFKKMLVGVGVENPVETGGLECLTKEQANSITEYIHQSLFQHYRLYEFMFSWSSAEEVIRTDLVVEVPKPASMPWPPPLDEAVSSDTFHQFIATPPPTPVVSESDRKEEEEEALAEDTQRMKDLMLDMTEQEVRRVVDSVADELLTGVEADVAAKIRERENNFIARINKIHRVSSAKSGSKTPTKGGRRTPK